MKRKITAFLLIFTLCLSLLTGCSSSGSTENTTEESADETIYGEVTAIGEDSITINVGTMKEMDGERSDGENADGDSAQNSSDVADEEENSSAEESTEEDNSSEDVTAEESTEEATGTEDSAGEDSGDDASGEEPSEGEQPTDSGSFSMLNLTGEEQVITLTDDTVYTKQSMGVGGQRGGQPSDDGSTDGEAPEQSTGDEVSDGESGGVANGAPDMNGENPPEASTGGEAPDMDGENGDSALEGQTGGEMPDTDGGNAPESQTGDDSGTAPAGDNAEAEEISLSDIAEGDAISITLDSDGNAATITVISMGGGQQGGADGTGGPGEGGGNGMDGQQTSGVDSYTAVTEYSSDAISDGETFTSTGSDENAILIDEGANVQISNATVTRDSDDSTGGDNSSFYGVGAAILNTEGTAYISDSTIESDSAGGAGVFSYGDGITYVADTTITTEQDTSGGIHVAGGGTLYAWDLDVETNGESSAAIRSDRGSGTMVVDGGTYTSNGTGSPAIYSTADISVANATLTANGSEAICIEGLNTIRLFDSDLTGNMADSSQNDCTWNVILYQSMSGDSEEGNSTFEMSGGSLTAENGGMFYTTNTESTFVLTDVDITYADDSEFFLRCTGNNNERGWGTSGSNGADCHFTAIDQAMEGDVIWDSISNLDFYMTDGSTLIGAVLDDETYTGNGGDGYCNFYIEEGSTWTVTSDSTLTNLYNEGTILDEEGNMVTIEDSDGTVYVEGTSEYTITVGSYEETVDLSDASTTSTWASYEMERPSDL